ncbi:MalY/PatB family protein [Leucobacter sp. W1153]|uniref:MalY/PatB family protein n=1 Tax=Leucobacter sp. W1153 TaxID=3439064 RepID=UPI003F32AD80
MAPESDSPDAPRVVATGGTGPQADPSSAETDPSGVPFSELTPAILRTQRTSLKWTRFSADILPLFVAEMDFTLSPQVQQAVISRVLASDTGYLDGPGELAPVFADFALTRWGWQVDPSHVHLATDVSCGIVEPLRLHVPSGGRVAITTPVYPSFFEMLEELPVEIVQIPLIQTTVPATVPPGIEARLDLAALERAFADDPGIDALVLSNPHNPHGLLHSPADLAELARLAATYGVFVISDEIHAPLTHRDHVFTPFAPLAAAAGALSVTATSASKGWNVAGLKCSVVVAADARANQLLRRLPPEVTTRVSILGLHANIAAFRDAGDWLDRAVAQIEANADLLAELIADKLPGVAYARPHAGYLAWLDFSQAGIGPDPFRRILTEAKVALGKGTAFGAGGEGHVRLNLACAPDTIRQAVDRIAALVAQAQGQEQTQNGALS